MFLYLIEMFCFILFYSLSLLFMFNSLKYVHNYVLDYSDI